MEVIAKNIYKTYHKSLDSKAREVLVGLDLVIESGQKIAIMGPSGSGKTTLLKIIGTLVAADSGNVILGSHSISSMPVNQVLDLRNQKIGFIFQFHHLLPQCTLLENVLLPTLPRKGKKEEYLDRAKELLQYMGLWEYRNSKPDELSGGECQRAAIARALINKPELILADEPTGSLDSENADHLMELLIDINKKMNITLILATHSESLANKMDGIYTIVGGKLSLL